MDKPISTSNTSKTKGKCMFHYLIRFTTITYCNVKCSTFIMLARNCFTFFNWMFCTTICRY